MTGINLEKSFRFVQKQTSSLSVKNINQVMEIHIYRLRDKALESDWLNQTHTNCNVSDHASLLSQRERCHLGS